MKQFKFLYRGLWFTPERKFTKKEDAANFDICGEKVPGLPKFNVQAFYKVNNALNKITWDVFSIDGKEVVPTSSGVFYLKEEFQTKK